MHAMRQEFVQVIIQSGKDNEKLEGKKNPVTWSQDEHHKGVLPLMGVD